MGGSPAAGRFWRGSAPETSRALAMNLMMFPSPIRGLAVLTLVGHPIRYGIAESDAEAAIPVTCDKNAPSPFVNC